MTPLTAQVEGIGLLGPGLADWPSAVATLCGSGPTAHHATIVPALEALPPAERRRAALIVRLALTVGLQATAAARRDPAQLASVFASSDADGPNCHELCTVLASMDRQVSPTRFHNSVHNAAAGYWSIATGATAPSNAISAYDASFAAGLLEALAQIASSSSPVLLVAYDAPYPQPLHALRPIADAFAVAFVLSPPTLTAPGARLRVTIGQAPVTPMANTQLESLRSSIPAARSLPLLQQLARHQSGTVNLAYMDSSCVTVQVLA